MIYDKDGNKYKLGKGLIVFVDGKKTELIEKQGNQEVFIGPPVIIHPVKQPVDYALNILHSGYPLPSGSINSFPDTSLYQAIDGRIWYFSAITNRWTTLGSTSKTDWYAIDLGQPREISSVKIYVFSDNKTFSSPDSFSIEFQKGDQWLPVNVKQQMPVKPVGNTVYTIAFDKISATLIRINFKHETKQVAISEVEFY